MVNNENIELTDVKVKLINVSSKNAIFYFAKSAPGVAELGGVSELVRGIFLAWDEGLVLRGEFGIVTIGFSYRNEAN